MANVVRETQGDGRPVSPAGVYRHRESGAEVIATATEKFGNPQGDAYVRLGFEYVGPVEGKDAEAVASIPDPHAAPVATDPTLKSAAELEVELNAAKAREAEWAKKREDEAAKADDSSEDESTELQVPAQTVKVESDESKKTDDSKKGGK